MRHFLSDDDLSPAEQAEVLDLAAVMKADRYGHRSLAGPLAVAVIFEKPSLRTRVSFEVGIAELGGHPLIVDARSTHFGRGRDARRRGPGAVALRRRDRHPHQRGRPDRARWPQAATVPVVNALTDGFHPCQVLADLLTVRERLGGTEGRTLGLRRRRGQQHGPLVPARRRHRRHARPAWPGRPAHQPDPAVVDRRRAIAAGTGGSVVALTDPVAAVEGADVIATDTWTSMGQESDGLDRARAVPAVPGQRRAAGRGQAARGRAALPARAPRRGDHRRGDGRPGQRGPRRGGEPAARAEGAADLVVAVNGWQQ